MSDVDSHPLVRRLLKPALLSLPVLAMAVGSGWFGDGLLTAIQGGGLRATVWIGLGLFVAGALAIYWMRSQYLPVRVLSWSSDVRPCRALVATVSPMNFTLEDTGRVSCNGHSLRLTGDIDKDAAADEVRWNWQQLLRAIRPHLPRLECIHLIGSSGEQGSRAQLGRCRDLLARYTAATVVEHPQGIDFEDVEAVRAAVQEALQKLDVQGYALNEIMLDSTGGHKTTSIAVALVTLDRPQLQFQYVRTTRPEPLVFNVVSESPVDLE